MDFEFVKASLAAKGYDVVYDINGNVSRIIVVPANQDANSVISGLIAIILGRTSVKTLALCGIAVNAFHQNVSIV